MSQECQIKFHKYLEGIYTKSLPLCLTLCDAMGYSPTGSSIHGILQATILEWVATPSSRGSSWSRQGSNPCLPRLLHWQEDSLPQHHLGFKPLLLIPGWIHCFMNKAAFEVSIGKEAGFGDWAPQQREKLSIITCANQQKYSASSSHS